MSHSKKLKVLVHSNHSRLVTGFGKNARNILLALHKDPDIEVIEAGNGAKFGSDLLTPWESFGTHPVDPRILQAIQGDQGKERMSRQALQPQGKRSSFWEPAEKMLYSLTTMQRYPIERYIEDLH